jgi:hypothetical protein
VGVPKTAMNVLSQAMRSVVVECPFFGRKVQKMGKALPSCPTDKTRKFIGKPPNIHVVRSRAKV